MASDGYYAGRGYFGGRSQWFNDFQRNFPERTRKMSDVIYTDDGLRLTYFRRSKPGVSITVARSPIVEVSRVALEWSQGTPAWMASPLYKLGLGNLDYGIVTGAARELARIREYERNRVPYRGQAEKVAALDAAHRICASVIMAELEEE